MAPSKQTLEALEAQLAAIEDDMQLQTQAGLAA